VCRPARRQHLLLILLVLISIAFPAIEQGQASINDDKQEILAFIKQLTAVAQGDAFSDPVTLSSETGLALNMEPWEVSTSTNPLRPGSPRVTQSGLRSTSIRTGVRALDEIGEVYYGLSNSSPRAYFFDVRKLSRKVCISRREIEDLFGKPTTTYGPPADGQRNFAGNIGYRLPSPPQGGRKGVGFQFIRVNDGAECLDSFNLGYSPPKR
jgi:hypothetical protein